MNIFEEDKENQGKVKIVIISSQEYGDNHSIKLTELKYKIFLSTLFNVFGSI